MSYYMFKEQDAFDFARSVGARTKISGDEIKFLYCPYCHGGSGAGRKDVYTFAINRYTGAFNCKRSSCDVSGNMQRLSKDFDFSLGNGADEYYRPKKKYRTLTTPKEPIVPKEPAVKYLESRGISEETAKKYEITTYKDRDNVLVFPFYDQDGKLTFIKYRKTDFDKEKDSSKEWCEPNCKPILFGMKQCNLENKTLIVAEGQIDSLSITECGFENAVSVPIGVKAFTWVPYCWDWVQQNFDEIIIFGDHEHDKITLVDDFSRRFDKKIRHVREEDYKDCKDANDILRKYGKEQIKICIENAETIPVRQVIDLADVEDVDIYKIEKVATGIKELDSLLYGGLPFGGVHLITGKAGAGKSTLASQIIIRAREQGYKCFAYSGELPNFLFKGWMTFQVAGRNRIFEYGSQFGARGFAVKPEFKEAISEWYRDYIFLYDNSVVDTGDVKGLLTIVEKVIQQYGVRVILLDNLMTALIMDETSGSDQYERQTDFVNKLRMLALRYNVIILLVAHMRKNNFSNGNDEIAGSSNIANIAMLTISYDRDKELPDNQRLLRLNKNRLFGKLNTDGITVNYDEKSKRIYGMGDDPDYEYGFSTDSNGFMQSDEEEDYGFTDFEGDIDPAFT